MDKSVDLFMGAFILLVIFLLTMVASNFILSNIFKKIDEVYSIGSIKSFVTGWSFNPGYPPSVMMTDSNDPVWQYAGLSYAEFRPIVNPHLGVAYIPPIRVYYGVIDPVKVYHLQVYANENNYVILKRYLGIPFGVDFNMYVEMPVILDLIQTKNFFNVLDNFTKNFNENSGVKYLRVIDSPYSSIKGDVVITGCLQKGCYPHTDNVNLISKEIGVSDLVNKENTHYYGVSYGIIPYKGTSLEYIVNVYQDFLSKLYVVHTPRVTNFVTSDTGYRMEAGIETSYPIYSKYLSIINPEFPEYYPQQILIRFDALMTNMAYKPKVFNDMDSQIIVRFVYLPVPFYSPHRIVQGLASWKDDVEKNKPFDFMVQVMFIPNVEDVSKVRVRNVVVIIEQEDLDLTIKKSLTPSDKSNYFYVFTYHWENYLKKKGYSNDVINKIARNYDHKIPLIVRIYINYEYAGEERVKAFSFRTMVWEAQDDGIITDVVNEVYRDINSLRNPLDYMKALARVNKLYDLYYKDVGMLDIIVP